ncbi:MAG: TetR/AcrR family transcriptional regulator [Bacteroidia bacterium]|nr:TetR/AcrR family transcriptional regulator [Bacteroidia bacterium]NND10492.1 TetR/AcrR family transcriptional regulator [Flavobacteriaceae bacterium]NNK26838.1 TetR/AcrR family transcriptional regulator [Flavobacteriaceae bacterium]RZV68800.1 MAG: TetR/AcrR family transcriptional regulator [Flavobacteriaceae bacterium]
MAPKATTKTSRKKMSKESIATAFTNYALEQDRIPHSVYKFCKEEGLKEEEFYNHFGSLESVRRFIWNAFHQNTVAVLHKNKEYSGYGNREKLLSYFFTMFEVLKLNRTYVLFTLKDHSNENMLKSLEQLKGLRKHVKIFASKLIEEGNESKQLKYSKHNTTIFSEGAWVQFLFILKFWLADDSAGFEHTDIIIEKSVNTVFDVFETTPLESVIDLGKFLWKEKMM